MENRFDLFMKRTVIPGLYILSMWVCLSCAIGIFIDDLFRGTAVAAALGLFNILRFKFSVEYRLF